MHKPTDYTAFFLCRISVLSMLYNDNIRITQPALVRFVLDQTEQAPLYKCRKQCPWVFQSWPHPYQNLHLESPLAKLRYPAKRKKQDAGYEMFLCLSIQKNQKQTHVTQPVPVNLLHYHHDIMYNRPDPRASWLQTPGDSPGRGQSHGEIIVFSGQWWNRLSDYLKHNQIFESALCCARIGEMIISRNPNVGMTSTVGNGNFAPNGRIDRPQVKACAASTWSFCSCFTCRLRGDWLRWQNFGGGNVTRAWFRTSKKILPCTNCHQRHSHLFVA